MELNERKMNILKAIVKDYIETAEAVGSRTISKKYNLGVSAATIRNEMADLEELGYLVQPYTSAGRVPTEKGYKLYVNSLMNTIELSDSDKEVIERCVDGNMNHIQDLIHETSKMLSQLTNYTTVAMTKHLATFSEIKHIQLVRMHESEILLIVVTEKGDIKKSSLSANIDLDQAKLNLISDNLTRKLSGKTITEIDDRLIAYIKYEIGEYSSIIDQLLNMLNTNPTEEELSMTLNGATNIFNYPEFNDVLKARSFLDMLGTKETIAQIVKSKGILKENATIIIGSDNDCEQAQECSVVTATYKVDEDLIGRISFIGPTRMDYSRIYSIINYMNILLNNKSNKF
ncbi:heat-inducible transcriptional repressor HrcA [Terrisporobacter mayombei]|uniref:Heat-inducible transcription repressor HrcA n=1 Tax=Terrisporobacter mayombei TaxID=1541 RepID=A0ABY9Q3N0_9FIRM|nr:heat-inducible transcriptional repressor HrcA [Terrisporobacter mayombei]MCC3867578.1 heat-inducible transcriptional repressor HrcA [Terrisporobacter mayombei]WMT81840.1 Heat-inducible transcription repressor HrcA [Terrisporobacter mayombei]